MRSFKLAGSLLLAITFVLVSVYGPIAPGEATGGGEELPRPELDPTQPLKFPEDHYRHFVTGEPDSGFSTEWWYFTGLLETPEGEKHGFFVTYFLHNKPEIWPGELLAVFQMAHYDLTGGKTTVYNMYSPLELDWEIKDDDGLELNMGGWSLKHIEDDTFEIVTTGGDFGLDLTVGAAGDKPMVINGDAGYIEMGGGGLSAYYSGMRLTTEGTMTVDGKEYPVTGTTWLDRQWGNWSVEEGTPAESYNWFSLRFDDGSDLMLYHFMDPETLQPAGEFITGTYQDADGNRTPISEVKATTPGGYWMNPEKDSRYPLNWELEFPEIDLKVKFDALYPEQELRDDPLIVDEPGRFWEGLGELSGDKAGVAFLEMDGYKLPGPAAEK